MSQTSETEPPQVRETVVSEATVGSDAWRVRFRSELRDVAVRDRWGRALWLMALVNLATFSACQALYDPKIAQDNRMLLTWFADLLGSWAAFRMVTGRWWYPGSSPPGVVLRIWVTFFILTFNSALMNVQTGWSIHWYRLAWPTLSTFGFATLAWLVDVRFLVPAVQMWLTGLIMVRVPYWNYAIYGASWSTALVLVGAAIKGAPRRDH